MIDILDEKREQLKVMYEQFKLGLLNEKERKDMRLLAFEILTGDNYTVL